MRRCDGEFSDGTVILASLIAVASLRPDEQLLNRVVGETKYIAPRYEALLATFTTRPVGSYERRRPTSDKASMLFDSGNAD